MLDGKVRRTTTPMPVMVATAVPTAVTLILPLVRATTVQTVMPSIVPMKETGAGMQA